MWAGWAVWWFMRLADQSVDVGSLALYQVGGISDTCQRRCQLLPVVCVLCVVPWSPRPRGCGGVA